MHFGTGNSRHVLRRACRTARRDMCSRASSQRGLGWSTHVFHKLFLSRCKSRARVHANTTASSWSAILKQARRDTHGTSCVSYRDVTQLVEFGLLTHQPLNPVRNSCKYFFDSFLFMLLIKISPFTLI